MALVWNESMSTGIPAIDVEHIEWIRRYNKFDKMVIEKRGQGKIQEALNFFKRYADIHFPHEEELADGLFSVLVEKNKKEHQKYRQQIKEIQEYIDTHGEDIVGIMSLKVEMEQWLINHITDTDVKLFKEAYGK